MSFSFRLNFKEYFKIILLQIVILTLLYQPISNSLNMLILFFYNISPGKLIYIIPFITLNLVYAPICVLHELLHAIAYKIIGGKPRIGFKGIYAYTMETSGKELSRIELLIVLMMPVVVISLICMILPWNIFKINGDG